MAGGLNNGRQGGGGKYGRGKMRPMSEINVTPFVDVMLVLLIIFMVAAPLLQVGIEIDAPETEAKAVTESSEPLSVTIAATGEIYVQETAIEFDNLLTHLQAVAAAGYDETIYIRADKSVIYDNVAQVTGRINAAGYSKIVLITD